MASPPSRTSDVHTMLSNFSKFSLPKAPHRSPLSNNSHLSNDSLSEDPSSSLLENCHLTSSSTLNPTSSLHPSEEEEYITQNKNEGKRDLLAENLDLKCQLETSLKKLKILDTEKKKWVLKYETLKSQLDSMELDAVHQAEEHKQLKKTYKQTCSQLHQLESYHQKVVDHLDDLLNEQSIDKLNLKLKSAHGDPHSSLSTEEMDEPLMRLKGTSLNWVDASKWTLEEQEPSCQDHVNGTMNSSSLSSSSSSALMHPTLELKREKRTVRAISIQVDSLASTLPSEMERLVQENLELQSLLENLRTCMEIGDQPHPQDVYPSLMQELKVAEKVHCAIQTLSLVKDESLTSELETTSPMPLASRSSSSSSSSSSSNTTTTTSSSSPTSPSFLSTSMGSESILKRRVSSRVHFSMPAPPNSLSISIPEPTALSLHPSLPGTHFNKLNRFLTRPQRRYCWVHQWTLFWSLTPPFLVSHHPIIHRHRIRALGIQEVSMVETKKHGWALVIGSSQRKVFLLSETLSVLHEWHATLVHFIRQRNLTSP
ncbi:hypothetical protein HMI54_014419 [Coelomomyces lativittatus]|nr:hypothetical protein HMI54_014419 [Coelomomyces lativittatus]